MAELVGGSVQQGVLSCTDTFSFRTSDIQTLGPDVFNSLHAVIKSEIIFICVCVKKKRNVYIHIENLTLLLNLTISQQYKTHNRQI